jgi:hypothetical protein
LTNYQETDGQQDRRDDELTQGIGRMRMRIADGGGSAVAVTYQALQDQAMIHLKIANFYRDAASRVQSQAGPIVDDWRQWDARKAQDYDDWQRTLVNNLLAEADAHDAARTSLINAAAAYQDAESASSGSAGGDSTLPATVRGPR